MKERLVALTSPNPWETSSGSAQEGREFTAAVVNLSKLSVLLLQKATRPRGGKGQGRRGKGVRKGGEGRG